MAVYTPVSRDDLITFLLSYDLGSLTGFEGIQQGVSNTNYFVTTDRGRYVLTLFEARRVDENDIPFFLNYMDTLESAGVPSPKTMRRKDKTMLSVLNGRPAAIFSVLNGQGASPATLDENKCQQAGETLAQMHLATRHTTESVPNRFGGPQWRHWMTALGDEMNAIAPGLFKFVAEEYDWVISRWPKDLPIGSIHADYFPDNVFFGDDGVLSGVIDFHFVCTDFFAYDLAIALCAWSFDETNAYREERFDAFLRGYASIRPLSTDETRALPLLLRAAALRFLLSRLEEKLAYRDGDFVVPHDPMVYESRLRHFQETSP